MACKLEPVDLVRKTTGSTFMTTLRCYIDTKMIVDTRCYNVTSRC